MHLQGLKEDRTKTVKCGSCGIAMRKRPEERMGLKMAIQECPRCGKRLISMDDAIRLQKRTLSGVGDIDTAEAAGNLKCICGRIAKRVGDLEHNGMLFWGWKCECGEALDDPCMANMYLKGRTKDGGMKTTKIAGHLIGPDRAEVRIREIQKSLGAEALRRGITKKDLLKALERTRKGNGRIENPCDFGKDSFTDTREKYYDIPVHDIVDEDGQYPCRTQATF